MHSPRHVLVVGGDAVERSALSSVLAPLGHDIVEAASGLEARHRVKRQNFSVIVLDARTPSGDAFETADFARSSDEAKRTPIILVVGPDCSERVMTIGYAMGGVDFVLAPVVPSILRGKVSLFVDLFAKDEELLDSARRLEAAATHSADALAFQLEMLDRMEQLDRTKSDFVSKISHELRSPLTSVLGYVELLRDAGPGLPTEEQGRMLAIIDRNSRRLLALIEDLLTMSRVDAGTFELQVGPVDLVEIIERVREATAPAVATAKLELAVAIGPDSDLRGDSEQLERALLNLVSNALKFSRPGGRVDIATRTVGDEIIVSVADSGTGVPLDEQRHLFTRFFRSTRAKQQQVAGTGLGLYIVKQIIELHGGAIEVESTPAGSIFSMSLPISGPPADPLALVRRR
ncbi:MAG TPA: hybrid sensor histidine kinase/response regulator [Acidimicrobiia bacterium]|nr:hybrid sensor histidine kinase/response regulator [Acidimicrobiia bacterium]